MCLNGPPKKYLDHKIRLAFQANAGEASYYRFQWTKEILSFKVSVLLGGYHRSHHRIIVWPAFWFIHSFLHQITRGLFLQIIQCAKFFLGARVLGLVVCVSLSMPFAKLHKEIRASIGFPVGRQTTFFLLLTSVLHQKTIKGHRPSVVCSDQYARHPLLVLLLTLIVPFTSLPAHHRTASLQAFWTSGPLVSLPILFFLVPVRAKTNKTLICIFWKCTFSPCGLWRVCRG